jgi:hypothetical protein
MKKWINVVADVAVVREGYCDATGEWPAVMDRMGTHMEAMGKCVITYRERNEITGSLAKVLDPE